MQIKKRHSYQFITEVVAALLGDAQRGFAIVVLDVRVRTGPEIIASSTKLVQDMIYKAENLQHQY